MKRLQLACVLCMAALSLAIVSNFETPHAHAQESNAATPSPHSTPNPNADPSQPAAVEEQKEPLVNKEFELRALDKMTARTSILKGPILQPIEFGNLQITVKACWTAPPDKRPEHAALMEIIEQKRGEAPKTVFSGWMFASSPALSALEHPVYDITVLGCHS